MLQVHSHYLLAVDFSPESLKATAWAFQHIIRPRDSVTFLHVIPTQSVMEYLEMDDSISFEYVSDEALKKVRETKEKQLTELCESYSSFELDQALIETVLGDPKETICNVAKDINATAVIIGSRGQGALKRLLLGSVSSACVHNCPCPILVYREQTTN